MPREHIDDKHRNEYIQEMNTTIADDDPQPEHQLDECPGCGRKLKLYNGTFTLHADSFGMGRIIGVCGHCGDTVATTVQIVEPSERLPF